MTEEKIGHCIRIAMATADITPPELAEKLGVSKQTAYSYAKGKCPSIGKLTEVAEACNTTYEEMLTLGG